ncbi:MAG: hypothetical protein CMJ75_19395 [Planctomycetaceae bacterium]|nr:hypothetical protein [Planctomycetaceae bacterium]
MDFSAFEGGASTAKEGREPCRRDLVIMTENRQPVVQHRRKIQQVQYQRLTSRDDVTEGDHGFLSNMQYNDRLPATQ